jgi:hypothetical protein
VPPENPKVVGERKPNLFRLLILEKNRGRMSRDSEVPGKKIAAFA